MSVCKVECKNGGKLKSKERGIEGSQETYRRAQRPRGAGAAISGETEVRREENKRGPLVLSRSQASVT